MISLKTFLAENISPLIVKKWNEENCTIKEIKIDTDTRNYNSGNAFFCIKGEKHDPFNYIENLLPFIPLVIFEANEDNIKRAQGWSVVYKNTFFLAIKNSVEYLQKLSELHVADWYASSKVHWLIAISGSNGKTTTKEMLYHLLNSCFGDEIVATKKNNNNHIGVPLTIFDIDPRKTKAAVVEFGSNHPGEIKVLCDLAHPNVGITTNIGHTHMEYFKELNDVFLEEGLIFHEVLKQTNNQGLFLINNDDIFLKKFTDHKMTKRFSCSDKTVDYFYEISHNTVNIFCKNGEQYLLKNSFITGSHNFTNLANAFILAINLFKSNLKEFEKAASSFKPTPNRSEWITYQGKDIFLDAYNANPSSMKVALQSFLDHGKNQGLQKDELFIVIGEMKELGSKADQYHLEFAQWLADLGLPNILYVGGFKAEMTKGYPKLQIVENVEEAQALFQDKLLKSKKCFIKASRSLQLERLVGITKGLS